MTRVFELAKEVGASSFEVLQKADGLDIEVYSALSQIDGEDVVRLRAVFSDRSKTEMQAALGERQRQLETKREQAQKRRHSALQSQRKVLEANRQRALEMDALVRGVKAPAQPASAVAPPVATTAPATPAAPEAKKVAPPAAAKVAAPVAPKAKPAVEVTDPPRRTVAQRPLEEELDEGRERFQKETRDTKRVGKPTRGQRDTTGGFDKRDIPPGRAKTKRAEPRRAAPVSSSDVAPDRIFSLRGAVIVKELAEKLGLRPNRLIADLMQFNILASINQRVEFEVAQKIADKYGYRIELERGKRSTERRPVMRSEDADDEIPEDRPELMLPRPPVVTFLGHVDHGKTSLMDRIRDAHVVKGEAGGITQHIGAYTVEAGGRKITFLDTPGHAAFSAMRARGAMLTDIAVIIIAADDGVMPQTREAIKAAQQANVQIMVAINKCDKPEAKPDRVRQMLQAEGLTPEEWGGDIVCVEVSALTGKGIDHLLEMILLQTDMLELTANPDRRADGYVIEAQMEHGRGPTAAVLVMGGTLKLGDILLCGEHFGRIRGLIDDRGRRVKSATPATAVKCMGLSGVPEAGASFRVMLNEKRARDLAEQFAEEQKLSKLSNVKATSLDALMTQIQETQRRELNVIVKADTQGSAEAICEALREIKSEKVTLSIIYEGIGNISATDVNNAAASEAVIVGFGVSNESGVQQLARRDGVRISTFRIIYELLEFVKQRMLDLLSPEYKELVTGHAEVRAIFDIGKTGRIAGCQMLDGTIHAKGTYRIFRKNKKIWEGKLVSLKHFQSEVETVTSAQECGIHFDGFEAFETTDMVECFILEELPRTL